MTTQPTGAVILVIDDLPANRRLMQAILTPHGYQVVEAQSGEQVPGAAGHGDVSPGADRELVRTDGDAGGGLRPTRGDLREGSPG